MMLHSLKTISVKFGVNGFADDEKFVEVDGEKFVPDETDSSKPKLGDDGKPVPFKAKEADADKDKGKDENKGTPESLSVEDLAKINPKVAEMLDRQKKHDEEIEKAKAEARKKAEEDAAKNGDWKKLADDRQAELNELKESDNKKTSILGKYKESTKKILTEITKTIPKDRLGLIPEELSDREKLEYVIKNAKLLGASVVGKGVGVDHSDPDIDKDELSRAESRYEELSKKQNKTPTEATEMITEAQKIKRLRAEKEAKK